MIFPKKVRKAASGALIPLTQDQLNTQATNQKTAAGIQGIGQAASMIPGYGTAISGAIKAAGAIDQVSTQLFQNDDGTDKSRLTGAANRVLNPLAPIKSAMQGDWAGVGRNMLAKSTLGLSEIIAPKLFGKSKADKMAEEAASAQQQAERQSYVTNSRAAYGNLPTYSAAGGLLPGNGDNDNVDFSRRKRGRRAVLSSATGISYAKSRNPSADTVAASTVPYQSIQPLQPLNRPTVFPTQSVHEADTNGFYRTGLDGQPIYDNTAYKPFQSLTRDATSIMRPALSMRRKGGRIFPCTYEKGGALPSIESIKPMEEKLQQMDQEFSKAIVLGGNLHKDGGNEVMNAETGEKEAETEREELMFTLEHTKQLESYIKQYDAVPESSTMVALGRAISNIILNETKDNSGKYKKLNR